MSKETIPAFGNAARAAVELMSNYLDAPGTGEVYRPVPESVRQQLTNLPLPTLPTELDSLLQEIARDVLPYPMGNGHPNFFGWVNSPALPASVVAALVAAAINPSVAGGDHAAVWIEHATLGWMKEILGLEAGFGSVMTSGGSSANLIGLSTGRNEVLRRVGWDARVDGLAGAPRTHVYMTDEAHSSLTKAVHLLGLGERSIRRVPLDDQQRMNPEALASMIAIDQPDAGIVCASAGTVNSGAIDPLASIVEVAHDAGLWLHVDGAYGAVGRMVNDLADRFIGMERADSISADPHKWLYIAIDCACVFVRDAEALQRTFSHVPPYLRDGSAIRPWFSEFTFEQTRPFRALKLWLALRERGMDWYRTSLSRDVELARNLEQAIKTADDFEMVAPVDLSIVAFRAVPGSLGDDVAEVDALNRELPEQIQRDGRVFLTGSTMNERPILRACFVNYRTDDAAPEMILEVIRDIVSR